jgi:predicted RNA binding protein YcfA (HicA-like mRNA interferase family)
MKRYKVSDVIKMLEADGWYSEKLERETTGISFILPKKEK